MSVDEVRKEAKKVFETFDNYSQGYIERERAFVEGAVWLYKHHSFIRDSFWPTTRDEFDKTVKIASGALQDGPFG